ncbi:helix-turn-helix domain-containing protein [Bacillus sp. FJAT-49736]|uniref:helix-turn-helix domain-containing protein n=1 Tax=Bacillus sp. FJAT-49736 TaxID=2833582 RepID=UPI001BC9EAD7|nr:helix-turn-helix domain-containing protein [Bacillus sp. FJAT-49736]MBS4175630.1 helix-turn-helix domain-containing protein [Bacillus sp. FJAT-49736]
MNIGAIIKLNRIKQNLTQEELAEGIISISYLSKIENGKIEPNDEVIKLLCLRLGIEINRQIDDETKALCHDWFRLLLSNNDVERLKEKYKEIKEYSNSIEDLELQILLKIHLIRYFLKTGDFKQALDQINYLRDFNKTFTLEQKYYWSKFNGNYYYLNNEFNEAIKYYTIAQDLVINLELSDEEIADLEYSLALTYSKLRITSLALRSSYKALEIYRQIYNFSRCAECHLLLGISYRRINNHDEAINNYELAKKLAEQIHDNEIIQLTHLNLGYLFYVQGNTDKAIEHLDKIVNEIDVSLDDRLLALTSIIDESYRRDNFVEAKKRISEALSWLNDSNKDQYLSYYYEIKTYLYLIEKDDENFENMMVNEFIPYLKEQKNYAKLTEYAELLANHFEKFHKYKNATNYYKLVNFSYKQITQI